MIEHAEQAVATAAAVLNGLANAAVPLAPLTTYRVGGNAALLARAESRADLERISAAVDASGIDVLVLGRGSNLLVSDRGFPGLVVALGDVGATIDITPDGAAGVRVVAGASVLLPVLARRTVSASLTGFEWAVGVPGSIGGAVRMNAGGHGADMAGSLVGAEVYTLRTGTWSRRSTESLGLCFRGSALQPDDVVVSAELALEAGERAASEAELAEIVRWRREHQPGGQNAGSVFVNPVPGEVSAGALIDELGLRGLRLGTAEVSTKHANFIQADPGGRASDVIALMDLVRERVEQVYGYRLRSEVRLVGFPLDAEPAGVGS